MTPQLSLANAIRIVLAAIALGLVAITANAGTVPGPAGCLQTQHYTGILKLFALDKPAEAATMLREMNYIRTQACAGAYSETQTIYYKNGQTATSYAGRDDATWYWPNGQTLTSYAMRADASMYYPNGQTMTSYFLRTDASYYYANGGHLSSYIGRKGSSLYMKDGSSINNPGFEDGAGQLDFISMADYVDAMNAGGTNPPQTCDNSTMKTNVREAIRQIQAGQSTQAVTTLRLVDGCL
ncbi:MAG: hypothetical protein V4760_14210 [Bdellovibrionota bacterium]